MRQHGVVSTAQLRGCGFDHQATYRLVGAGLLYRLHRGAYAVGHRAVSDHGRDLAAVLACGPGAVLSHRSAAALWGIRQHRGQFVEVTVPGNRRQRRGIRVHVSPGAAGVVREGIPVTTPEQTLIDLADVLTPSALRQALATAERLGLVDRATLVVPPGRRAVVRGEHVFTRSRAERLLYEWLDAWGFERPLVNQDIGPWEVDFYWPDRRFVLELDFYETHGDRAAFERDREKDAWLQEHGYVVLRVTGEQLKRHGPDVRRRLGRLLGDARFSPPARER